MVDWMLGHTQRFKAFISHSGVYDLRSMFGATEELWFPLWEFNGTPWDNPGSYEKWSPSNYVKDFKTPTLVIHGELDFRVPYTQGLQLFTALQLQKIPSKLLEFPDEGHWILKPQNSVLWYHTFLEWIGEWTKAEEMIDGGRDEKILARLEAPLEGVILGADQRGAIQHAVQGDARPGPDPDTGLPAQ